MDAQRVTLDDLVMLLVIERCSAKQTQISRKSVANQL